MKCFTSGVADVRISHLTAIVAVVEYKCHSWLFVLTEKASSPLICMNNMAYNTSTPLRDVSMDM